jgi:hypothetical protein
LNSRIRELLPKGHFGNRKGEAINRCLMALSRILLPELSSCAGKYGQDPMGMKYRPIPRLWAGNEVSLSPETERHRALCTSLLRERNRLSDALHAAKDLIRETLERT